MAINWNKAGKGALLGGVPGAVIGGMDDQWFGGKVGDAFASLDPNAGKYEARRKAQQEADRLAAEAASMYDNINLPGPYEELKWLNDLELDTVDYGEGIQLESYTPEMAELALLGDSAFKDINLDPRFREAQMAGLSSLDEIIDGGGMSAADEASLARIQNDVASADRGRREAIKQNMQQRGMSGSGLELLAQLQSNQSATDRASQMGLDVAGMSQDRMRQAIMDKAGLSSQMESADYSRAADKAQAMDAINRFNISNRNQVNQWNTANRNDANRYQADMNNRATEFNKNMNINEMNTNTDIRNNANQLNWSGKQNLSDNNTTGRNNWNQNQFSNSMDLATGRANAKIGQANQYQRKADQYQNSINATNQGLINLASTGAQAYLSSDEDCKHDIEPIQPEAIEEFLEAIKPKKFRYKNKKHGEGERVGIVIQDIEPTEIGASITTITDDGTKAIDKDNLLGVIMDSLSHLHDKKKDK